MRRSLALQLAVMVATVILILIAAGPPLIEDMDAPLMNLERPQLAGWHP